ncbi:MAG: RibD family protein, partial [Solirubrobacterales bacterium]|nr:RibD family protein [Solirubrobacterales bacterium]
LVRSAERRARRAAAGLAADPCAVLVSRDLDLPWEAGLFAAAEQPILIYTNSESPARATPAHVEVVALERLEPPEMLADLRRRGIGVLLCEGGPTLNAWLLAAGAVDELFLTLAPLLTGHAHEPTIVGGPGLPAPTHGSLQWILRHGDELFLRYRLSS